jgi:hypothetical protein
MVPEAPLEQVDHGQAPAGEGWFVLNARDARWRRAPGRGHAAVAYGRFEPGVPVPYEEGWLPG